MTDKSEDVHSLATQISALAIRTCITPLMIARVSQLCDTSGPVLPLKFDEGSVRYDPRAEEGWAARGGFPICIISRRRAILGAAAIALRLLLLNPRNLWDREFPTYEHYEIRDTLLEINRAYPPFKSLEKRVAICKHLIDAAAKTLTARRTLLISDIDDFLHVVRASCMRDSWKLEKCLHCKTARGPRVPVLMLTCGHILCDAPTCARDVTHCPLCLCQTRTLVIDSRLVIPRVVVMACIERAKL